MKDIIFGLETEYAFTGRYLGSRSYKKAINENDLASHLDSFFEKLLNSRFVTSSKRLGRNDSVISSHDYFWQKNGAKIYYDMEHIEYSTPECRTPEELIIYDKAGMRILEEIRGLLQKDLEGKIKIIILKNNVDSRGNSYGSHESYLVAKRVRFEREPILSWLVPFFVTRPIYAGSGRVVIDSKERELRYNLSQRAFSILNDISRSAARDRGIIYIKSGCDYCGKNFRRLQIVSGDSNMADFSQFLKFGTVHLLIRALEKNSLKIDKNKIKFGESISTAINKVSQDLTLEDKIVISRGKKMTALEIQESYLEDMLKCFQQDRDFLVKKILREWTRVLLALRKKDFDSLSFGYDAFIKLKLIEQFLRRAGLEWSDPERKILKISEKNQGAVDKISAIDLFYHDINPEDGLYLKLEKSGQVKNLDINQNKKIMGAVFKPPKTRANIRSRYLRVIDKLNNVESEINWHSISQKKPFEFKLNFPDPFCGRSELLENKLRKLKRINK